MPWQDELLEAARKLNAWAGVPYSPLWLTCPCCGQSHHDTSGCRGYWTCAKQGGVQCDPPPNL